MTQTVKRIREKRFIPHPDGYNSTLETRILDVPESQALSYLCELVTADTPVQDWKPEDTPVSEVK